MFNFERIEFKISNFYYIILASLLCAIALFATLPHSSEAKSAAYWNVLIVEGPSEWRVANSDANWQSLAKDQQLPARVEIRTHDNAHAVIVHGFDKLELEPNSKVSVMPEADEDATTAVNQLAGKVGYSVQKRKASTFSVTAPFLVAVVKGTSFTVDVNEDSTQVDVDEGTVAVTNASDGETATVTAGMTASVSASTAGVTTSTTQGSNSSNSSIGVSAEGGTSGAGGVEGASASVGVGVGEGGVGAGVGVGAGGVGVSAGVGVGDGGAEAGVGVGAGGVGASAGVGVGDSGAAAGVGADAGGVGASAGVGVGDSGVGADAGAGGAGDVGVGVGVSVGDGGVGVGVGVGGIGIGIGIGGSH